MDFPKRLRNIRGDLKQEDFALKLGIKKNTVGRLERGEQYPDFATINRILRMFPRINSDWLLTGEGSMYKDYEAYESGSGGKGVHVRIPGREVGGEREPVVDYLSFRPEWVRNALGIPVGHLAQITVTGDAMEPTLSDGDIVLLDTTSRVVTGGAVYVLQSGGALLIKRLQYRLDGSVVVKSDNQRYEAEIVSGEALEQLRIIGRVVWSGCRM